MKTSQWLAVGMAGLLFCSTGVAAPEAGEEALPSIQPGSGAVQEKKSKLKFKRGPTCMCVRGTSEEEIRQAEEKLRAEREREQQ